jgi:hypothetical protein
MRLDWFLDGPCSDASRMSRLDFQCIWPSQGTEAPRLVLDPRTGKNTGPEDTRRIAPLVELAVRLRPAHQARDGVEFGKTQVKCFVL